MESLWDNKKLMIICGNLYYMIGSFNYLSSSGEYDGTDVCEEEAVYSTNGEIINNLYKRFDF